VVALAAVVSVVWSLRSAPRVLVWRALLNATYPTSLVRAGALLKDGVYEVAAAPGSASKTIIRLADIAAFGDLDGDGLPDAATVLIGTGGGSGTFVELSAVRNEAGVAHPLATTLLGDRVLVRGVAVADRVITVRLRARGATDPLTLRTREITRGYALDGDRLVLQSETETEVPTAPADDYVYRPERIDLAIGASRDVSGSLAPGQLASYIVHARASELLGLSLRSEFDNAILSVSGLSDGGTLVNRREYAVDRALILGAEQDYAVKVVSLAGQPLQYTLHLSRGVSGQAALKTATPTSQPLPSHTPSPPPSQSARPAIIERGLGDASGAAASFASSRPPILGVAVYVPSRAELYSQNADTQMPTASVVKVLVMLVVLEQARLDHRPPTESELALLWPMITESDNDATSELWERIGRGQAVGSYVRGIGISGFTPDPEASWGVSFVSARAMATVLGKLLAGEILDDASRALALRLLEGVIPEQRWGVTASTSLDGGDRVAVKNGWYPGEEGWRVNSVGIVWPRVGTPYAIAVVSDGRPTWQEGIDTIEGIAAPVNVSFRGH
jgi:beta-lactamase class A